MTTIGDPSKIRPALGQLAADHLVELQQAVLDSALSAMRPTWLTVTCGSCGATSRVEAPLPDARTRLQGIELLLKEGLGPCRKLMSSPLRSCRVGRRTSRTWAGLTFRASPPRFWSMNWRSPRSAVAKRYWSRSSAALATRIGTCW